MQVARLLRGAEIQASNSFYPMDVGDYRGGPTEIARLLRAAWKMPAGPVDNLVLRIETAGGIVFTHSFGYRRIDALSQWLPDLPPVFFMNTDLPGERQRFTLAHELGHVIMHRIPTETLEDEAHQFAAEFLMPAGDISPDLEGLSLQRAAVLKEQWKVSIAALIHRAFDLGKISKYAYQSFYRKLNALGYRTQEPLPLPAERPTLVAKIIDLYRTHHGYDVQRLCKLVASFEEDFRQTYLADEDGPLRLKLTRQD